MGIPIKNDEQIKLMRISNSIAAKTLQVLAGHIKPGVSTGQLNKIAEEFLRSQGAVPSFKGYRGFPAAICTSINEQVIHGVPGLKKLKDGDIISIDIGAYKNGFHGDCARTYGVGNVSGEARRLMDVTMRSFFEGIKYARAGRHLHEISQAVQNYAEANGFSVVQEYVGHGIGRQMHEEPNIPNYKQPSRGPRLVKGMTLAVEPMVNTGTFEVYVGNDNQTVLTRDGKNSAHYENTILITDGEPEILTLYETI
jgi:methionyl aminopeptidase